MRRPGRDLSRLAPANFHTAGTGQELSRRRAGPGRVFVPRALAGFLYVAPSRTVERMRTDLGWELEPVLTGPCLFPDSELVKRHPAKRTPKLANIEGTRK